MRKREKKGKKEKGSNKDSEIRRKAKGLTDKNENGTEISRQKEKRINKEKIERGMEIRNLC
jgi:hypothetical protein